MPTLDDTLKLAAKVSDFLFKLVSKPENRARAEKAGGMPDMDFQYGEALWRWKNVRHENPKDAFITADIFLLEFRREIVAEFGLRILNPDEAKKEAAHKVVVAGHPQVSPRISPKQADEQLSTDWGLIKKARKDLPN